MYCVLPLAPSVATGAWFSVVIDLSDKPSRCVENRGAKRSLRSSVHGGAAVAYLHHLESQDDEGRGRPLSGSTKSTNDHGKLPS